MTAGDNGVQSAVQLLENAVTLGSQGAVLDGYPKLNVIHWPRRFKACCPS